MKAVAIIPARLQSTRLPRKMLREIEGRPLVVWVYQAVRASPLLAEVIVATDSREILDACRAHSCHAQLTAPTHHNGSERVHEVARSVDAEVYLNVQGDEPLVGRAHVASLLSLFKDPGVQVGTLKTPASPEDILNPHAVKLVTDTTGRVLYFSRCPIPYDRDGSHPPYFKHLGIYGYRKPALERFVALEESRLERAERLEQLRFLENGIPIYAADTPLDTIGVDTDEDFERVEKLLLGKYAGERE
jgi:3-deoxy-manno-octulosonate cytidylyltransferase (CMP-KDO synthetase)